MIERLWPPAPRLHTFDRVVLRAGRTPGYCLVCARATIFTIGSSNLREDVVCTRCGSFNRQRQIALVLLDRLRSRGAAPQRGVEGLPPGLALWSLEAKGPLHEALRRRLGAGHVASEYLSPDLRSGDRRNGVLHVDLQATHFADASLDAILSSDVLEHVPRAAEALRETWRVLKPGGLHVFTAPFYMDRFRTEQRAIVEGGTVRHLMDPIHHLDPVRPAEGVLVYQIFGVEIGCELERLGFRTEICLVRSVAHGILGDNGVVVVAAKPA